MDQHHPQQDWSSCQLLVALHELCVLPTQLHFLCLFERAIPVTKLYGVTSDISIIMMCTFYQSVYYASHNQSFPSTSEGKYAVWVDFGQHVSDVIMHKLMDASSNKIIHRCAVHPADDIHHNKVSGT